MPFKGSQKCLFTTVHFSLVSFASLPAKSCKIWWEKVKNECLVSAANSENRRLANFDRRRDETTNYLEDLEGKSDE